MFKLASLNDGMMNFTDAIGQCEKMGCKLAKISSASENAQVISLARDMQMVENMWFGLHNLGNLSPNAFRWVEDDSILSPLDYQSWCAPGLPPSSNFPDNPSNGPDAPEQCGLLWLKQTKCDGFGYWNDAKCGNKFPFAVCRCHDAPSTTLTAQPTPFPSFQPIIAPTVYDYYSQFAVPSHISSPSPSTPSTPSTQTIQTTPTHNPSYSPSHLSQTSSPRTNAPSYSPNINTLGSEPYCRPCPVCVSGFNVTNVTTISEVPSANGQWSDSQNSVGNFEWAYAGWGIFGLFVFMAFVAVVRKTIRRRKSGLGESGKNELINWEEKFDDSANSQYWINKKTGEFSWTNPTSVVSHVRD